MKPDYSFTADEVNVLADQNFFRKKAAISAKIKRTLEQLHKSLKTEVALHPLLAPEGFDPKAVQLVKGEHLEECPYQYLDFPRYYTRQDKLAFRSLFWWGHHLVFALIVEGPLVKNYRVNLFNRFSDLANCQLSLCLSSSLWEWKAGSGFTLDITHNRRSEIAAALDHRTFFKIARFISIHDLPKEDTLIIEEGRKTFKSILPIITP